MVVLMKLIKLALLVSVTFWGLSACGQKGPLYLPTQDKAAQKPPQKYTTK